MASENLGLTWSADNNRNIKNNKNNSGLNDEKSLHSLYDEYIRSKAENIASYSNSNLMMTNNIYDFSRNEELLNNTILNQKKGFSFESFKNSYESNKDYYTEYIENFKKKKEKYTFNRNYSSMMNPFGGFGGFGGFNSFGGFGGFGSFY